MITAKELRQMMGERPVTLAEIQIAACDAVRHGASILNSEDLNDRPLANHDAEQLRHLGYKVFVQGDRRWSIQW